MQRPNTQGCTEFSCPFHGRDNREKHFHDEGCPVRETTEPLHHLNGTPIMPACKCDWREWNGE